MLPRMPMAGWGRSSARCFTVNPEGYRFAQLGCDLVDVGQPAGSISVCNRCGAYVQDRAGERGAGQCAGAADASLTKGISTLRDRVCMTAAMLVFEPIFEADLPSEQYPYRRGRMPSRRWCK